MQTRREILVAGMTGAVAMAMPFGAGAGRTTRNNDELAFASARTLAARVAKRDIGIVELTEYFIRRIETYDSHINAVVVRDFDRALDAARQADNRLRRGDNQPLYGVPVTVKESFDVQGLQTTWGMVPWKDMVATEDSHVAGRLKEAGAIILGKTNVPPMLVDYQSSNDVYGQTGNPWDLARTPGGSSGGSAAALAGGLTGFEYGSDIGGSIRNPAHYCGVFGHKSTWGIVPSTGHKPPVQRLSGRGDIAVLGPMARSAADLALGLKLTAGPRKLDAPGWRLDLPKPGVRKLSDFRVAFWHTDSAAPVSEEIANRSRRLMERLEGLGATVSEVARPDLDFQQAHLAYLYLMQGALSSGTPESVFQRNVERAEALSPDDRSPGATMARAAVQSHNEWTRHDRVRNAARHAWRAFFDDWDVLVCPMQTTTAFPHDNRPRPQRMVDVNGQQRSMFEAAFWAGLVSMPGLPSTVFPTGLSEDGLPIGLQAVGGEFNDLTTIEFAGLVEHEFGGYVTPPLNYDL